MARTARRMSESGVYHVMLRGINRQRMFEDERDNERFLEVLDEYKAVCGYELLGYCLMGNHVHILLRVGDEPLATIFRRIAAKYVYWYNAKYRRVGHLFQERFKSEPIEGDEHLLAVLRYIHRNPVKAGLCATPGDYELSSYNDYMGRNGVTDTAFVLSMMPARELDEFSAHAAADEFLDVEEGACRRLTDDDASDVIGRLSGCRSASAFQDLPAEERDRLLGEILAAGVSVRQASRLTGVSVGVVRKFTPSAIRK